MSADERSATDKWEARRRFVGLSVGLVIDEADVLDAPLQERDAGGYVVEFGGLSLQAGRDSDLATVLRTLADRLDAAAVEP